MSTTNWYDVVATRAIANATYAGERKVQVHTLTTAIGPVCVTFEGHEHGRLTGVVWTPTTVRVNNRDWRISGRYQYLTTERHWENSKLITHDPPVPIASFSCADMLREGNHNATSNANWKAEVAIGAAIAALDAKHAGMLAVQARMNETEIAAQEQERHATRSRERAAESIAHAERHERNAAALRAGTTVSDYDLQDRRVY